MLKPMHVLFVCTGNICRSPTAERLAVAIAAEIGISDFSSSSAGTRAVVGHPIEATAARILEGLGGNSTDFYARLLTKQIATEADLILAMTERHRDQILAMAPTQFKRTFTLREAARLASVSNASSVADLATARSVHRPEESEDIADPIGKDTNTFDIIGNEICTLLGPLMHRIVAP